MLGLLLFASVACGAVDTRAGATASIEEEIARLEGELTRLESADVRPELRGDLKIFRDRLSETRAVQSPLARLYRLRDAYTGIESMAMMVDRKADAASLDKIQALWNEQQAYVVKTSAKPAPTLMQRALVESANNRAEKLFKASLPYAKVTEPAAGLYYISDAVANRRFADFAAALAFPEEKATPPASEALRNAWTALETDALKVFEADPGGRTAITPSARLKETRELLDRGFLAGATLLLLETRLELSKRGTSASYPSVPDPRADSIREMWASLAAEQKDADSSKLVTAQVLPLYDSLEKDRK